MSGDRDETRRVPCISGRSRDRSVTIIPGVRGLLPDLPPGTVAGPRGGWHVERTHAPGLVNTFASDVRRHPRSRRPPRPSPCALVHLESFQGSASPVDRDGDRFQPTWCRREGGDRQRFCPTGGHWRLPGQTLSATMTSPPRARACGSRSRGESGRDRLRISLGPRPALPRARRFRTTDRDRADALHGRRDGDRPAPGGRIVRSANGSPNAADRRDPLRGPRLRGRRLPRLLRDRRRRPLTRRSRRAARRRSVVPARTAGTRRASTCRDGGLRNPVVWTASRRIGSTSGRPRSGGTAAGSTNTSTPVAEAAGPDDLGAAAGRRGSIRVPHQS